MRTWENFSKPTGRPAKLDRVRAAMTARAIRAGCNKNEIAEYLDIGLATLMRWTARGRAGEPKYADFVELMDRAGRSRGRNDWRRYKAAERSRKERLIASIPAAEREEIAAAVGGSLDAVYQACLAASARRSAAIRGSSRKRGSGAGR